ncbi:formylglycine-generating enzyme family protein [Hydrogenophaga pseudoflava]|nr:formylglycine-generating enzyme family protein [Hydrogenophaga pseudoflava]MDQ7744150.1 formylglycine-generating enzyme family protein [Hydrogenophaga pseudoflava]
MDAATPRMRLVPGGVFTMGSDNFYPEERPSRRVSVDAFLMDETPVTNAAFAAFVAATGHVTVAEKPLPLEDYPGHPSALAIAGSAVFDTEEGHGSFSQTPWWQFRAGACWRHPQGPGSDLSGLELHPVVHVAYTDAAAYAEWVGKSLPTEAEWEFAARSGLVGSDYAWGDELAPGGAMLANYWQGEFPHHNSCVDGWFRTSPVGSFPANAYGLVDLIGNVWEWTEDWWSMPVVAQTGSPHCCSKHNPRGGREFESLDPMHASRVPRKVIKGGSYLCAENHCRRYRPAARHAQAIDSPTGHLGFRCVVRL